MRAAVANSKRIVSRVQVDELYTAARLRHHRGYRVTPEGVMRGFLVLRRGCDAAIDLHQNEAGRIIRLLDHVEADDARLLQAVARVFDGGCAEGLDGIRLDVDVYVNNQH